MNLDLSINFLKSQQTIGELRKVVKEAQSPIKLQLDTARGDKFVARQETKHPQVCDSGFHTSFQKNIVLSDSLHNPLTPRTSDLLSKININNIKNTETYKGDVIRSMGIEML